MYGYGTVGIVQFVGKVYFGWLSVVSVTAESELLQRKRMSAWVPGIVEYIGGAFLCFTFFHGARWFLNLIKFKVHKF